MYVDSKLNGHPIFRQADSPIWHGTSIHVVQSKTGKSMVNKNQGFPDVPSI